jgi:putative component of membrane protein insertase Oxa1/YidC/SpoIIIJ protein YidD
VLAAWRLLRCNPFSHGGFDPVEAQRLFRPRPVPSEAPPARPA